MVNLFEYVPFGDESFTQLIHEAELPAGWEETIAKSFSAIAPVYSTTVNTETHNMRCNQTVDELTAWLIRECEFSEILDVGVGDGARLLGIAQKADGGSSFRLHGTDISDAMIDEAGKKGIEAVKHDMIKPLPFAPRSIDMILYLSGDFGYIMHPTKGEQVRAAALKSAYETLKKGGMLVLDLRNQDNGNTERLNGRVAYYRRRLVVDGTPQPEVYDFWLKNFRLLEVQQLFATANIPTDTALIKFIVNHDTAPDGTVDASRSGTIIQEDVGFKRQDISKIVREYNNGTSYRLLVVARKP